MIIVIASEDVPFLFDVMNTSVVFSPYPNQKAHEDAQPGHCKRALNTNAVA